MAGALPTPDEVKAARIAAGLTQRAAAELVGVTLTAWQRWEADPKTSSARRISPAAWELFQDKTRAASAPMKTPEEAEDLKRDWENDPSWDLENTEGFERYRDDLLAFRLKKEAEWSGRKIDGTLDKSKKLGCSLELVLYIERLEYEIEQLQQKVFPNG